ncbi:hypothetical protein ACEPAG_8204 [Sanghuangporus baumii]
MSSTVNSASWVSDNSLDSRMLGKQDEMRPPFSLSFVCISPGLTCIVQFSTVTAQPSPEVQSRVEAAIEAAANATNGTELDHTAFVNPFIGTNRFARQLWKCPVERSRALWQEKLRRVQIDIPNTPPNVTDMFYSSLYGSFLTPVSIPLRRRFCKEQCYWGRAGTVCYYRLSIFRFSLLHLGYDKYDFVLDVETTNLDHHFRTFFPWMGLHSPVEFGEIVEKISTGGGRTGGCSSAGPTIFQVVLKEGPMATIFIFVLSYWYVFTDQFYRNVWDPTVESNGFQGFMQKHYLNGTFANRDPMDCSPQDTDASRSWSLIENIVNGFYESSAWEYSFFASHDTAHLIELMGGNDTFVERLDHFFDVGYYLVGNEPSFKTPVG